MADKLEADNAEIKRKQQEEERHLAEQRRLIAAEREELEEKQRKIDAEENRKLQLEIQEKHKVQQAQEKARHETEMLRQFEERKPDIVRLRELAAAMGCYNLPDCKTAWADKIIEDVSKSLMAIKFDIENACDRMEA